MRGLNIRNGRNADDAAQRSSTTQAERVPKPSPEMQGRSIHLLGELAANLPAAELRNVAQKLLRIADAMDQEWRPDGVRSAFSWPSAARRIERNSLLLARRAKSIQQFRQDRAKYLPSDALGEPAWDMLLELFCQFSGRAAVSSKSLTIASGVPQSTALRYLDMLENEGLIKRRTSDEDRRVTLVELTKKGVVAVGLNLEKWEMGS